MTTLGCSWPGPTPCPPPAGSMRALFGIAGWIQTVN
jgi:hypothetical protein